MEDTEVFVGLDYHTEFIQVCVLDRSGREVVNRRCGNDPSLVGDAVRRAGRPVRVAVESCCGAADFAEDLMAATGWRVSLAHPGYVSRMKASPDKSDVSDARMLAELCRADFLPTVWLAPEPVRELRIMVRWRGDLVARRKAVKLRILALLREQRVREPGCGRWSLAWRSWLGAEAPLSVAGRVMVKDHLGEIGGLSERIERAEATMTAMTREDAVVKRLLETKGIGPVTAWTMRAFIGRFDRFRSGKQLSRFCAVTPKNASSGQRVADAGLIKAGDPLLKTAIIQAAQRLRRFDPEWRAWAESMSRRGKPACVVIGAVANRWTRKLFHQMKEVSRAA